MSDGRPSSQDPEELYRFGIEDMYALRQTMFQSKDQSKVDLFVKVLLHDCNAENFNQNEFLPGRPRSSSELQSDRQADLSWIGYAADDDVMYYHKL